MRVLGRPFTAACLLRRRQDCLLERLEFGLGLGCCGAGILASMFLYLWRQLLQVSMESNNLNTEHEDTTILRNVDKQTLEQRHNITCHRTRILNKATKKPTNPLPILFYNISKYLSFRCIFRDLRFLMGTKPPAGLRAKCSVFVRPKKVLLSKFTETPERKILWNLM